ncbi:MAG: PAS domain-containing protein [Ardenticatenaceae bacterium]|nr:PAS domain-containing protein [Ardenticatenaceae bacterium]
MVTQSSSPSRNPYSPIRLWVTSVVTILLLVIIVVIIYEHVIEKSVVTLTSMLEVGFVSITVSLIIPPLLYIFSYRPLLANMSQLQKTQKDLNLLDAALHSADDGIVITDNKGNIEWANPSFARMMGVTFEELSGKNLRYYISNPATPGEERWETILSGEIWRDEMSICHSDGQTYVKERYVVPVRNGASEISHLIFIEKDITRRRQLEKTTATLANAALALNQSLHTEEVLDVLLDLLMSCVLYDNAAVVLLHHDARWAIRAYRGPDFEAAFGEGNCFIGFETLNSPPIQTMLTNRETVVVQDSALSPALHPLMEERNGRNWLGIPLVVNGRAIGFCILDKDEPHFFSEQHVQITEALVNQAAGAVENAILFEEVQTGRERLKSLSHRLVKAQETERHYIARELHDEAGQALASLKIQLLLLSHHAEEPQVILNKVPEIQQQVDDISENLHRLAAHLRPASLDHLGLITALAQYVRTISEQYGLIGEFEVCGFKERLAPEVETAVYRIVQEALTNVIRHAQAGRVDVFLKQNETNFVIVVEDDGKGFDPINVMTGILASDHLGLVGIRERTEMLGGTLILDSSIGNGTTLKIEVPYDNSHLAG